jgi:hypothetical protein
VILIQIKQPIKSLKWSTSSRWMKHYTEKQELHVHDDERLCFISLFILLTGNFICTFVFHVMLLKWLNEENWNGRHIYNPWMKQEIKKFWLKLSTKPVGGNLLKMLSLRLSLNGIFQLHEWNKGLKFQTEKPYKNQQEENFKNWS